MSGRLKDNGSRRGKRIPRAGGAQYVAMLVGGEPMQHKLHEISLKQPVPCEVIQVSHHDEVAREIEERGFARRLMPQAEDAPAPAPAPVVVEPPPPPPPVVEAHPVVVEQPAAAPRAPELAPAPALRTGRPLAPVAPSVRLDRAAAANLLRERRIALRLSQKEMSTRLRIHHHAVGSAEAGMPTSLSVVQMLEQGYGLKAGAAAALVVGWREKTASALASSERRRRARTPAPPPRPVTPARPAPRSAPQPQRSAMPKEERLTKRMRDVRAAMGLSQSAMAVRADVNQTTISAAERGQAIGTFSAARIEDAYGLRRGLLRRATPVWPPVPPPRKPSPPPPQAKSPAKQAKPQTKRPALAPVAGVAMPSTRDEMYRHMLALQRVCVKLKISIEVGPKVTLMRDV